MRILGIDPGSRLTGYGLVEKQGTQLVHVENGGIFTQAHDALPQKLFTLYQGVEELIDKFKPQALAIENIFYAKNVKSTLILAHARGALMVAGVAQGLPVYEYSPLAVKQALVGYGQASKEQIQHMVKKILKLPEATYSDASDALAVAICHLHSLKMIQQIEQKKVKR